MSNWKKFKLADLSERITKGTTPSSIGRSFTSHGINFIKAEAVTLEGQIDKSVFAYIDSDTNEKLKRSKLEEGDILFSMAGIILGKTALVKREHLPANTNQALALIRLKKHIVNPEFVHYFFRQKSVFEYVNSITAQSAQPNINLMEIGELEIPLPPFSIQNRIASILSCLDDKIERNRRMNKTLERIALLLFERWFIDYDFPDCNGMPYKTSGGRMKNINFEEIPEQWDLKSIYNLATFINGAAYKNIHFSTSKDALPIIKIVELKYGIKADTKFTAINHGEKYKINHGDVLFSWSGSPETSIDTFLWIGGSGWLNQHIFKVITDTLESRTFIYFLLKYLKPNFIAIAKNKQTTGLGHVTISDLQRTLIAYPDNSILSKFSNIVTPLLASIENNLKQMMMLTKTRDTLLPKLMSGEIDVEALSVEAILTEEYNSTEVI